MTSIYMYFVHACQQHERDGERWGAEHSIAPHRACSCDNTRKDINYTLLSLDDER